MRRLLAVMMLGAMAGGAFAAPRAPARPAVVVLAKAQAGAQAATLPARTPVPLADDSFRICFNYSCMTEQDVWVPGSTLDTLRQWLASAPDAAAERAVLAQAVGMLLAEAGRQTPVAADRGGNFLDQEVEGRMDCIDHSTSTTRILRMIEAHGWLRFHQVLEPVRRTRLIMQHFGAVVEEVAPPRPEPVRARPVAVPDYMAVMLAQCDCAEVMNDVRRPDTSADGTQESAGRPADDADAGNRYVVDSWFVDNGEAAIVLPLAEWLEGGGPNVQ